MKSAIKFRIAREAALRETDSRAFEQWRQQIPFGALCGFAVAFCAIGGLVLAATAWVGIRVGAVALALPLMAATLVSARLSQTAIGRGFIWKFGKGMSPTGAVIRQSVITLIVLLATALLTYR